jgi:2-keto-4-pentenoate hydratase/2-oxohepta-3-ene-1,7-dioic acid hydratase in catechol pathway
MKILRASMDGQAFYAELKDGIVKRITSQPYGGLSFTGEEYKLGDVELLAPCEPSKVVAVGLNYSDHAKELNETLIGNPVLFIKPSTSVLAHGQAIVYPPMSQRMDYEAELAVVIGKKCRNVSPQDAAGYIFGYTAANDVTARDIQKSDGQWTRGKSFDTFCPIGPYIDTEFDPKSRRIQSVLSGVVKQDGNTADMLFPVAELISFISACMTLLPGDVVSTGTPVGVGPMKKGDTIEVRIEGLETLKNIVV